MSKPLTTAQQTPGGRFSGIRRLQKLLAPLRKSAADGAPGAFSRGRKRGLLAGGIFFLLAGGLVMADWWTALPADTQPHFVGRETCARCHAKEAEAFRGSHHDHAMDLATEETVRGDFSGVELEHHGVRSRMYKDGDRFMVRTEGPDGEMQDFHVKYVFGWEPLQQYMVEFDRTEEMDDEALPRVQVLRISWDTQRQQWFHLDPPDVDEKLAPEDDLHWTGVAQRWQTMCAECHSTNLEKNFDVETASYHTTFSEIDVSCEACHGPGSTHVEIASQRSLFWDRRFGYGLTAQLKGDDPKPQLDACAPCHSRRGVLASGFKPGDDYHDFYDLELLRGDTYHGDGQILDEVYVYGSFIQSKMYHKGIRCTDCHDPHTLRLKAPGNQLCTSCHAHPAGKYDVPAHHHHAPGTAGAACVDCHMPSTTYMAVDPRRDHSIRIPRPDLSVELGTPNACAGCHVDPQNIDADRRDGLAQYADWLRAARAGDEQIAAELARVNRWSDQACERWYGDQRRRDPHFAEALVAAREGAAGAEQSLADLATSEHEVPVIARATALDELARLGHGVSAAGASQLMEAEHPLVRAAAARAFRARDARQAARVLGPFLDDPSRLVRNYVARALVSNDPRDPDPAWNHLSGAQQQRLSEVLEEVHASLMTASERAGAHMAWGLIRESLRDPTGAVAAYQAAIRVEPRAVGPRSNLAGLLERLAESGSQSPEQSAAMIARAEQLRREELPLLERDARLAPELADLQFRVGQLRYLVDEPEGAVEAIRRAVDLEPANADFRLFLALLYERLGQTAAAREEAEELVRRFPEIPSYRQLQQRLAPAAP